MAKAVVLLSGGLDSSANLVLGRNYNPSFDPEILVTVDYGQRSAAREIASAKKLADYFKVKHITIPLDVYSYVNASSKLLNSKSRLPTLTDLDNFKEATQTAAQVWVPNRNGLLINVAAAIAESENIPYVAVGFNREEAVTFPDNSERFLLAINDSLKYSTQDRVQLVSATIKLNKVEIVRELLKLDFPFDLIWSCYETSSGSDKQCGKCESCQRSKRAYSLNNINFESFYVAN